MYEELKSIAKQGHIEIVKNYCCTLYPKLLVITENNT